MSFIVGIPTLLRYDLLGDAIDSIFCSQAKPDKIVVVDNGRTWEPPWKDPPIPIDIFRPEKNLGVAGSWNTIHRLAGAIDTVYMNDDAILATDSLGAMLATDGGLVTAAPTSSEIDLWACFLQRQELWDRVGEYDAEFWPAYFEDSDYRYRMKLLDLDRKGAKPHGGFKHARRGSGRVGLTGYVGNAARYERKWGGPPGYERFRQPFNNTPARPTPKSRTPVTVLPPIAPRALEPAEYSIVPTTRPSGLVGQPAVLKQMAERHKNIRVLGESAGGALLAILAGRPKTVEWLTSASDTVAELLTEAKKAATAAQVAFTHQVLSKTPTSIAHVDMLLIDTCRVYDRMMADLCHWHAAVRRTILIPGTISHKHAGEITGQLGIWPAIKEFLDRHQEWRLVGNRTDGSGMAILEKR